LKEKIARLAEGEFERDFPEPLTDPDIIEKDGVEGSDITGSFRIYTDSDLPLDGMVCSSNPYVKSEQSDFSGKEAVIDFTAHTGGFYHGQTLDGAFSIICDGFSRKIPYTFTVIEKFPRYDGRDIKNLADLYELEKTDRREAVSVFSSEEFKKLLIRHFPDSWLSYRALTGTMGYTPLALENFLCENGLKEPVRLHVFPAELNYYAVNEDIRESFRVTRNTDGYVSLCFSVPEDSFVSLENTEGTDSDFYGGTLEVPFFIRYDRIHQGLNTTKLTIRGNGILIEKDITVSTYGKGEPVYVKDRERKNTIVNGLKGYLDFRLRKTDTMAFLKSATDACEYFLNQNPADVQALLYRTMAQIVAGQKQKALTTISLLKEMIADKKSFEWAFLLYLCTLMDSDESYIDTITREIEGIQKELDDPRVFWFLLFLRKEYTDDPLKRLSDIRKWINRGCHSPVLYAEALDVMNAYPEYIGQIDSFSLSILRFGQRNGVLSHEIVKYVAKSIGELKTFNPGVFDFAGKLYDRYDDDELLSAIDSYLLRNRCVGEQYKIWYKRGIELDLNLTGIYETYMSCIDDSDTDLLPRMLLLYFSYDVNEISDEKREYLYANVIMYKDRIPDIYETYKSQTERFAIEKLQGNVIDDFLSIIYRDLYQRKFFDDDLLSKLKGLKNSRKVFCLSQKSGRLSIYTPKIRTPYVTELKDHAAVIDIPEENFFTVLTNQNGTFAEKELFYTEKLLPELSEIEDNKTHEGKALITEDTEEAFADSVISSNDYDSVDISYLPAKISLSNRRPEVVTYYLRKLIEEDRTGQAFSLIKDVYGFLVPENVLLHLATKMCENSEEDEFLTGLSIWLLDHYLSNEITLKYLCANYRGPLKELVSVFKYAKARGCEVTDLAGRILEQMMYEEGDCDIADDIFMSYVPLHSDDKTLIRAYLTYFSDRYVLGKEKSRNEDFFTNIRNLYVTDHDINQSVKTALLKHYAFSSPLKPAEFSTAEEILRDNILDGRYFSFYKKMDIHLVREFGLYERVFIEVHFKPGKQLVLTLNPGSDKERFLDMDEAYDGIYISSLILFHGDSVPYEVKDQDGNRVDSGNASNQDYPDGCVKSRFGLINEISEEEKNSDSAIEESIREYIRLDVSSEDLFSMV